MSSTLRYSALRILLFVAALGLLWLVGLKDPLWLLLAAATVSMLLSLFLLAGERDRMSAEIAARVQRGEQRSRERRRSGPTDEDIEDGITTPGAAAQDPDAFR